MVCVGHVIDLVTLYFTNTALYDSAFSPPKPFKLRICRFGAGIEKTEGRGDTPGVELTDTPYFETARSGFRKLRMPRNDKHVNQVSAVMLQSWRANCDVQILIYDSHPDRPNLDEIARVMDYVVGYNCKGAKTAKEEKDQIIGIIKKYVFPHACSLQFLRILLF